MELDLEPNLVHAYGSRLTMSTELITAFLSNDGCAPRRSGTKGGAKSR